MTTEADDQPQQAAGDAKPNLLQRILAWLTAGYPEGIPAADRFPVIAVLKRRLSDDEVREIVTNLTADGSAALEDGKITQEEVEEHIAHVLKEQPNDDEIRRVSARLAAGGWPLAWSVDGEPESAGS